MTVSESIIEWLRTFDPKEYWKMKNIDTDIQNAKVDTYSLVKEPVQNVKCYMSGKKLYTEHYMIQARMSSNCNADRIDNNGFGEALESWVREQNAAGNFPSIDKAIVRDIYVTTPFYMGKTETNNSIYQMTIAVKYLKEK